MSTATERFETWGVVEVMGHKKFAGLISERVVAGAAFVQVDVPAFEDKPAFTKLFGPGSIYCITPLVEQLARGYAQQLHENAISIYDLPLAFRQAQIPFAGETDDQDEDDDEGY